MTTTAATLYSANQSLTVTGLTTLASDANLLAGWQSDKIDMAAALGVAGAANALDLFIQLSLTAAGSGLTTGKLIQIWGWGSLDGSVFPTGITGSVGTVTLAAIAMAQMKLLAVLNTDATASRVYGPLVQIAPAWGGCPPPFVGLFVVHNMGAAFAAASGKLGTFKAVSA